MSALRRVANFLAANLSSESRRRLATTIAELDDAIANLEKSNVDQEAATRMSRVETSRQEGLRAALWDEHMLPVSRIAREVLSTTGANRAFAMPRKVVPHVTLIIAARAMAEAAEKERDVFVKHGLPRDFASRLRDAATTLEDSLGTRVATLRRGISATASVQNQLKRGRRAVRLLDATLLPQISDDPAILAAWRNAKTSRKSGN